MSKVIVAIELEMGGITPRELAEGFARAQLESLTEVWQVTDFAFLTGHSLDSALGWWTECSKYIGGRDWNRPAMPEAYYFVEDEED